MRSSVKRIDMSHKLKIELGLQSLSMPGLDVEKRWSSTFNMVKPSYESQRTFSAICSQIEKLQDMHALEHEWRKEKVIFDFLEEAARTTKQQSASIKNTLSLTCTVYQHLQRICQSAINGVEDFLVNIAQHMRARLKRFEKNVCSSLAMFFK